MGTKHLISTGVRRTVCLCGTPVLVALTEGLAVAVTPNHVDPLTEITALFAGHQSFDLVRMNGHTELMWRDNSRIRSRRFPVVIDHLCPHPVNVDDPGEMWKKKTATPPAPARVRHTPPPF